MLLLTWVLIGVGVLVVASVVVLLFALWLEEFMQRGENPTRTILACSDRRDAS